MSGSHPSRAEVSSSGNGAPARNPITYNLAALRLAQSPNGAGQVSQAFIDSSGGPCSPSRINGGPTRVMHLGGSEGDIPLSVLLTGASAPSASLNNTSWHPPAAPGASLPSSAAGGRSIAGPQDVSIAPSPSAMGYPAAASATQLELFSKRADLVERGQAPPVAVVARKTASAPPSPPSLSAGHPTTSVAGEQPVFHPHANTNPASDATSPSIQFTPSGRSAPHQWEQASRPGAPFTHSTRARHVDSTQPSTTSMQPQGRQPVSHSRAVSQSKGKLANPQPRSAHFLAQHTTAEPTSNRGAFHPAAANLSQPQIQSSIAPPPPRSKLAGMPAPLAQASVTDPPPAGAYLRAPPQSTRHALAQPPHQQRSFLPQSNPYPVPQPFSKQAPSTRSSVFTSAPLPANTSSSTRHALPSPSLHLAGARVPAPSSMSTVTGTQVPVAQPAGTSASLAPSSIPIAADASQLNDICSALQTMRVHARVVPYPSSPSTYTSGAAVVPPSATNPKTPDPSTVKVQRLARQTQAPLNYYAARHSDVEAQRERIPYGKGHREQHRNWRQAPPLTSQHQAQGDPVAHAVDSNPAVVRRFEEEYAQQNDTEGISDDLRAQQATKTGTVGTLDEELCLSLIETHDVTFVVTDTGTGKSTRIPMALHRAHPDALVVNAQPRRTAAINLAQRVAEVLNAELGEEVGYSVRGEHIGDLDETKIMYVTTYSLFIYFLWHEFKESLPFSYIIVDEFHERTPDVEVILLMLKLWLKKHPGAFKLVLCSATAQVEEWQGFFDGLTVGTYARSPIMYPVREYFIEDLQGLIGIRTMPIVPQDSSNTVSSEQMHQLILVCKQLLSYLAKNTATQDSVLVFMPGRTQVELMTTWIRENLEESMEPIAWYRDVELSLIQEAFARPAVTRKKVYVATDIAEVSLTLPDVVFVIDSGTGKRPQVSEKEKTSYAFPPLRLLWETTSNAQQRRGRIGRVQQGFYFCLLSRDHHKVLRESDNRIKNAVLTELVLHSLLITQKPFAFFQLCNEKPERGALAYSLHLLQDGGHIIRKDDPMADAERVALHRQRTTHVMDSPWNALIEEALAVAYAEGAEQSPSTEETAADPRLGDEVADNSDLDEEDSVAIVNPQTDAEAFKQCYFMTLRGVIAARSPVSVAAATNIFFGLLYGTPTLSMLAAAIESCKSPFHVPYTISDRMERMSMVRHVSSVMQRYHGHLQSDLICSMEVILEYMSMQRDGLSEEAQEEWCQERSLSRTRVVDTLNLFSQMKEQVSSVLPFPDVTDIDVLNAQFHQNAELLVLMLVASHTELAIQVQLDGPVAQRKGFVGHGMFFPLKCLKDESVPTVCPWDRTKISVPLSLQTIQRKVLAVFASQVEPDLFALVLLVFSYKLQYSVQGSGANSFYLMAVSHSGVRRAFQCDTLTAQQILQIRRIQCAQMRCMQLQVEEGVRANESERLSAALKSAKSDFGLPDSATETPYLIPTVLQHALKLLVGRLKGSPSYTAQRRAISEFPPGTPYCKLSHGTELPPPVQQSVLVHSNNGLSLLRPAKEAGVAAPHVSDAATEPLEKQRGAVVDPPTLVSSLSHQNKSPSEEEDSDCSSDSGAHVPTFSYDM